MADRVVLHVGLMKSGTSYLQHRMDSGRKSLASAGVLFPGPRWGAQVVAVSDVLEIRRRARGDFDGAWERMVERVRGWPGAAVISMEFLGPARPAQIDRVVESFAGTRVEVVVTARDLNRAIPAMWQEMIKNGGTWAWHEYVEAVRTDTGAGSRFWRQQRLGVIVKRWSAAVGSDAVTVVTVPPPGAPHDLLWLRFCEAIGLDPVLCPSVSRVNESLGAASVELLRRVNLELGRWDIPWSDYSRDVKFRFAKAVLGGFRPDEEPIGLPLSEWITRRAASMRANVEATGVRVIGDLDDLTPVPAEGVDPSDVPAQAHVDVSAKALATLLRRNIEQRRGERLAEAASPIDSAGVEVALEALDQTAG